MISARHATTKAHMQIMIWSVSGSPRCHAFESFDFPRSDFERSVLPELEILYLILRNADARRATNLNHPQEIPPTLAKR